jgi:hypothetical protein
MPVTRTNTRRYVAICEVVDCPWSFGPHGLRLRVSEQLRHHLKHEHGMTVVDERTSHMKVHKDTELPEQSAGVKLSDYAGQLIVFGKRWEQSTRGTKFGDRKTIDVHLYAYDTARKGFVDVGSVSVFFATVQKRLMAEGPADDIGGVLVQGTERNGREWDLSVPSAAQVKLLDKFDPDTALPADDEEPF